MCLIFPSLASRRGMRCEGTYPDEYRHDIHPCDGSGVCKRVLTHGTCMRCVWEVSVTYKCKNEAFFTHFRTESNLGIRRALKSRICCTGTTIVVPKKKGYDTRLLLLGSTKRTKERPTPPILASRQKETKDPVDSQD